MREAYDGKIFNWFLAEQVLSYAAAEVAKERERCAKICESLHHNWRWDNEPDSDSGPRACAAAIRAQK
jgi:hypothetical protein